MKRTLAPLCAVLFTLFLAGCGDNGREDAINGVITMMETAGSDVKTIRTKVEDAVKKADNDPNKLDLSDAAKAAENLEKETGKFAQRYRREVEIARANITDQEKEELASRFRDRINGAFKTLVTERDKLKEALQAADKLNPDKTQELREKIRKAEAPFESLARQS
jgi:type VI protein secretion system component VasK